MSIKNLFTAGALMLVSSGCITAKYNRQKVNQIPRDDIGMLESIAEYDVEGQVERKLPMPVEQSKVVLGKYGNLPAQDINIHVNGEIMGLDTNGPYNGQALSVAKLENLMCYVPCDAKRMKLELGDSSKEGAGKYQLSTNSGLLGVESFSDGHNYVFIDVKERRKLDRKLNKQSFYNVNVTFGEPALNMMKKRNDSVILWDIAGDAGIGIAITGNVPGALIGAGIGGVQHGIDYFKGRKPPFRTDLVDDRITISNLDQCATDTWNTLVNSDNLGTGDLIAFNYSNNCSKGIGVVHFTGLTSPPRYGDIDGDGCIDTLCLTSCYTGSNFGKILLGKAFWGFTRLAIDKEVRDKVIIKKKHSKKCKKLEWHHREDHHGVYDGMEGVDDLWWHPGEDGTDGDTHMHEDHGWPAQHGGPDHD